jgi:demethoxyubiquinone hydroxylase (CLK1/Coq7/Cat5 family)
MATQRDGVTVQTLNELLRGELAAVETYSQALGLLAANSEARADLRECQLSHEDRVLRLRAEILQRGGRPSGQSGAWGVFARLVEGGAKIAGPKMAVTAIEAGEDHGLKEYQELLPKLDLPARSVVAADIYPQQVRTRSIVSALKYSMETSPAL